MNLGLEHLKNYFNYGLRGIIETKGDSFEVEIKGLNKYTVTTSPLIHGYKYCSFENIKPLLRPLSDLTKEIKHGGEKFVPIVELLKIKESIFFNEHVNSRYSEITVDAEGWPHAYFTFMATMEITVRPFNIPSIEYWIIEKLFEWHFDIFGLSDQGLALPLI